MEAMIRHENDGGIFAGFLQQSPQHPIVELVRHRDHVVVQFEVAFPDPGLPRRMVLHEAVAEVIDRVEVDREEIPRLVVHQPHRSGMHAHTFRQRPHAGVCAHAVSVLVSMVPTPRSVSTSRSSACGTRASMMWVAQPPSVARMAASTLGIIPSRMTPAARSSRPRAASSALIRLPLPSRTPSTSVMRMSLLASSATATSAATVSALTL